MGVFVFELLTGHPPFEGDKPSDIFDQISDYASAGDKANQRLGDLLVQAGRLQGLLHELDAGIVLAARRDLDDGVDVACGRANGQV